MSTKKKNIIRYLVFLLVVTLFASPRWIEANFGEMYFDQVLFLWFSDGQGSNIDFAMILSYLIYIVPIYLVSSLIYRWYFKRIEKDPIIKIKLFGHEKEIDIRYKKSKKKNTIVIISLTLMIFFAFDQKLRILNFFLGTQQVGELYETNYVDPNGVELTFPEKKQNVVYIVLESMETSFSDVTIEEHKQNLIPNLQELSEDNYYFSHKSSFGGGKQVKGATWTAASLVGQTSGVPIQISKVGASFGEDKGFLEGIVTLGEILEKEGYRNYFMAGSDAKFGGRETYFKTHGNYKILDTKYYKETGKIDPDYNVFWGFEDQKLFEFAKEELIELAKSDQPFNFTMLTVDTHFTEGYTDASCKMKFKDHYPNAILCSDEKIVEFVNWIMDQDFYENTTIILTGDHFTMNNQFTETFNSEERAIYNAIINPRIEDINQKRLENRAFSVLDLFPTTLSSLGVDIEGDRLGLGVNLFSNQKTLIERFGAEKLDEELGKKSDYYNDKFFGKEKASE